MDIRYLIAKVESDGRLDAVRFEPVRFERFQKLHGVLTNRVMDIHKCDVETAHMILATSYGCYQLLGETLYSIPGLVWSVFHFMTDKILQEEAFTQFSKIIGINDITVEAVVTDLTTAQIVARRYNGPGNIIEYANRLQSAGKLLLA